MVRDTGPWLLAVILVLAAGGCSTPQGRSADMAVTMDDTGSAVNRFQAPATGGRTPMESAIELSEKYAKLSDQAVTLRQENQRLTSENEDLRQQITGLEAKLQQTQKELGEANELLIEMLAELNNWKNNILGFRSEMRDAAKAQLEALLKVLEILGGQAEASTLEHRHAATLNPDVNDVPQPGQPSVSVGNEPSKSQ